MIKKAITLLIFLIPAISIAADLSTGQKIARDCSKKFRDHASAMECESKAAEELNVGLKKSYADLVTEAREHDAEMLKLGSKLYVGQPHLNEDAAKKSQDAFVSYMEAECDRISAQFDGASGAGDASAICKIDIITERLRSLK